MAASGETPTQLLLIDTGWGLAATEALLATIEADLGQRPRAAIVTDFPDDRAGGIAVLRAAGVEVWSSAGIRDRLAAMHPVVHRIVGREHQKQQHGRYSSNLSTAPKSAAASLYLSRWG